MSERTPDCAIHIKRLDDAEHRIEAHHVRLHKQDNLITEVKMQAGLLDLDFNHHQASILKSVEAQRDSILALRDSIEAEARRAISLQSTVDVHSNQLLWTVRTVTAAGLLALGAVLTHFV